MKSGHEQTNRKPRPDSDEFNFKRLAIRIVLTYWVLAMSWIFFSDQFIFWIWQDPATLNLIQTYKGFFFMTVSSVGLYIVLSGRVPLTAINLYQNAKRAEKALSEIENKMKGLSRSNLLGLVVWDLNGKIRDANQEFLRMVGYTSEELRLGKMSFCDLLPQGSELLNEQAFADLRQRGSSKTYEKEFMHQNGRRVPVLMGAVSYSDNQEQAVGFVLDLTELKKTEEERNKSQERLRLALEATTDCFWEWNLETDQTYYSPRWYTMLGYQMNEFPANLDSWKQLTKAEDVGRVIQIVTESVKQGHGYETEFQMRAADGSWRWILGCGRVTKWDKNGVPTLLSGTNTDITEKKNAQFEAERIKEQLLRSQKVESIGRLAGGVAHDFNNILMSIIGFAELIRQGRDAHASLDQIQQAADRGAKLTNQLLCYARKKPIAPAVFHFHDVVAKMESLLTTCVGEENKLEIQTHVKDDRIHVDLGSLEQVILNICINARDAIMAKEENGNPGEIRIVLENIFLDQEKAFALDLQGGEHVLMKISDNGIGMTPEIQKRIFEPFFTTKTDGSGTGLGLSVCQGIIQQCGGNIVVRSEFHTGSTFEIYIPRYSGEKLQTFEAPTISFSTQDQGASKIKTILVVDDETSIREFAKEYLTRQGFHVLVAKDGEEALNISNDYVKNIDLLLTDIVMPKMDGTDLARTIQKIRKNIKVIYTSGYIKDVIMNLDVDRKQNIFIQKPFRPADLLKAVQELLGIEEKNESSQLKP